MYNVYKYNLINNYNDVQSYIILCDICQNIVWTYITEEIYRKHNNEISCMRNVKDIISLPFKKIFLSVKDSFEISIQKQDKTFEHK
jgi:hypothetical protein